MGLDCSHGLSSPTRCVDVNDLPPRRIDFELGKDGRRAYHNARAAWYKHRTGRTLTGTTAQMERQYDNACRFLRARTEELCRVCHLEVREEGEKHKMCRECWDKKSKEWPPGVAAMIVNQCN